MSLLHEYRSTRPSPTMGDFEPILEQAERNQERLAAVLRLVVFVTILVTALSIRQQGAHHHPLLAATLAYGALSFVGVWLAWRNVYRRWIPYAFVTCEVLLLTAQVVLLGGLTAMPSGMNAAMPITGLIFVFLVHAAMRYRPWLIVYGAALFLLSLAIGRVLIGPAAPVSMPGMTEGPESFHQFFHYEVFPVVTLVLATFILVVTARGTRLLLRQSLENNLKVARFSRFFPSEVAKTLAAASDDALMGGERIPVAVLFADIRGFSALAERMDPETLGRFITDYRQRLVRIVESWGGAVDKFIGDGVMAVFGIPQNRSDDAARALNCALEMIDGMEAWSEERHQDGQPAVNIGIGLHHGEVFAGVLGGDRLLEFTVIGDTVNVAERLERLTRSLDADIAVSADLLAESKVRLPTPPWNLALRCRLPGRAQTLDVHYIARGKAHDLAMTERAGETIAEIKPFLAPMVQPDRA